MFAAKHGMGFLIINAMQLLQTEEMLTVAVMLFAFAAAPTRCCCGSSTGCTGGCEAKGFLHGRHELRGKMMVEFFSTEISAMVCRVRSCSATGCCVMMSAA